MKQKKLILQKINKMEKRTKDNPWKLKTPPLTSEYQMYIDEKNGKEIIVCTVGKTVLHYDACIIKDMHDMLIKYGDWMLLGSKDEKAESIEDTVEHWGRSENNPIGGWYGLKKSIGLGKTNNT